jgi:hypothetical protein
MTIMVLHARGDAFGEAAGAALGSSCTLRLAVGDERPKLALGSVRVAVIWNARAAGLGWAVFAQLLSPTSDVLVVLTDETPLPSSAASFSTLDWRCGGAGALRAALSAPVQRPSRRVGVGAALWRAAAGIMAVVGLATHGGVASAQDAPTQQPVREATVQPGSAITAQTRVPAAEAPTSFATPTVSPAAPYLDLDQAVRNPANLDAYEPTPWATPTWSAASATPSLGGVLPLFGSLGARA